MITLTEEEKAALSLMLKASPLLETYDRLLKLYGEKKAVEVINIVTSLAKRLK